MRTIFAGTPWFAREALAALHAAGHEIVLVLSQPDRPAGRGMKLAPSPVKAFALEHGLAIVQPPSLRVAGKYPEEATAALSLLREIDHDVMVVAAYGLILPPAVLALPRLGCLNIHASLLPRWRGAAPIQRAIEAGDAATGITIMRMDAGLDTGPILMREELAIGMEDTAGSLTERLAALGARLILEALNDAGRGALVERTQPDDGATYAAKISRAEAQLDFGMSAARLAAKIRAFNPVPGATALYRGASLKFWRAHVSERTSGAAPGTILAARGDALVIACGHDALCVTELQRPGAARLSAAAFLKGAALEEGAVLG